MNEPATATLEANGAQTRKRAPPSYAVAPSAVGATSSAGQAVAARAGRRAARGRARVLPVGDAGLDPGFAAPVEVLAGDFAGDLETVLAAVVAVFAADLRSTVARELAAAFVAGFVADLRAGGAATEGASFLTVFRARAGAGAAAAGAAALAADVGALAASLGALAGVRFRAPFAADLPAGRLVVSASGRDEAASGAAAAGGASAGGAAAGGAAADGGVRGERWSAAFDADSADAVPVRLGLRREALTAVSPS